MMAKRLVKSGVTVIRDGARVRPEIGKLFDFSKEELEGLKGSAAIGPAGEAGDEDGTAVVASGAQTSQGKARGGRKAATANKSDAEVAAEGDDATDPPEGDAGKGAGAIGGADDTAGDDDL